MAKKPLKIATERYKNLSGKSTVATYQLLKDAVTIGFTSHGKYIYSNQSAGSHNVSKMKTLAIAGKGLGTFIENTLKDKFARKVR
jgi:hypothetical protein